MVAASQFCIAYVIVDMLCLTLTVIIASNVTRESGSETQVRYFFLLLSANLVFDIFDAVWATLVFGNIIEANSVLLSVVNGLNLLAIAFAGYFWFSFSLAHFESQVTNSKRLRMLTAIPAVLVIVFHTIGYFTNQNVVFMPNGSVSYGVMHTINTVIPLFYLASATAVAINQYRNATTRAHRRMSIVFIGFMIPPASAGIIDIMVPDMPVAAACIMISIVFVMMSLQESHIFNDALTGLNNRRRAEAFLEEGISHATPERPLCLFIIDLDQFKNINDTYGHLEGDHALRLMADALRRTCSQTNAFAARWGGDEFVVISPHTVSCEPEMIANLIRSTLEDVVRNSAVQYKLACTVGYALCQSDTENPSHLISNADAMLYRNKQTMRSRR